MIRVGPEGASPLIVGVPMESAACAAFEIDPETGDQDARVGVEYSKEYR